MVTALNGALELFVCVVVEWGKGAVLLFVLRPPLFRPPTPSGRVCSATTGGGGEEDDDDVGAGQGVRELPPPPPAS